MMTVDYLDRLESRYRATIADIDLQAERIGRAIETSFGDATERRGLLLAEASFEILNRAIDHAPTDLEIAIGLDPRDLARDIAEWFVGRSMDLGLVVGYFDIDHPTVIAAERRVEQWFNAECLIAAFRAIESTIERSRNLD